jgi:hypothetical protein
VKIETKTRQLTSYWTFELADGMQNGIWTVEIRVDGQPAGSHPFELAGIPQPKPAAAEPAPAGPKQPTLDAIYRSASQSMVWVYKLDEGCHGESRD